MPDLAPEKLADWDADAERALSDEDAEQVSAERIRTLIRALRASEAAREEATQRYNRAEHERMEAQRVWEAEFLARDNAALEAQARAVKAERQRDEAQEATKFEWRRADAAGVRVAALEAGARRALGLGDTWFAEGEIDGAVGVLNAIREALRALTEKGAAPVVASVGCPKCLAPAGLHKFGCEDVHWTTTDEKGVDHD